MKILTEKIIPGIAMAIGFLVLIAGLGLLTAFPIKWLINGLFSESVRMAIFGVSQISVWTAWGLSILSAMLFKSTTKS